MKKIIILIFLFLIPTFLFSFSCDNSNRLYPPVQVVKASDSGYSVTYTIGNYLQNRIFLSGCIVNTFYDQSFAGSSSVFVNSNGDLFAVNSEYQCDNSLKTYDENVDSCVCPLNRPLNSFTGQCECPSGTEPFSSYSCQIERYDDNFGCVTPCQAGYQRNLSGSCCPIGLDVFCNGDGTFSDCKCPDGSTMLEQSDGTFLCESGCPDGQILNSDGTCRCSYDAISNGSECTTCEFPYVATIQNECVDCGNNQTPDTNGICSNPCSDSFPYYFPISEDSTSKIIIPAGGNSQVCYDLGDNLEDTSGDNVSSSDTPDGTTTTTETTTNDDGTTTTTETTTEIITNDDGTKTTNTTTTTTESDGTSTSNTTSETSNKEERNYDKAFEDIGDEIIKNRNEIKKSSNKNSEDLQKIEDELKKTVTTHPISQTNLKNRLTTHNISNNFKFI